MPRDWLVVDKQILWAQLRTVRGGTFEDSGLSEFKYSRIFLLWLR